jgi:O-succinylbenzoic acid--CoA ligase
MNFLEINSASKATSNAKSPAIITTENTLPYSDLQKQMIEIARSLIEHGINKGDYVSIISYNNKDFVVLVLALWLIDAIPVPINTRLNDQEIENLIAIAGLKKILLHKDLENKFNISKQIIFPFNKAGITDFSLNSLDDTSKTAVVIFTSGSTGTPKGVMLSFQNLISSFETGDKFLQQSSKDRWLASLPFYHIGGFSIITRTLLSGASMIIPDSSDIKDFTNCIQNFKPTLASFVGTQLRRLIDENINPVKELRNILIGGGFVDDDLIKSAINAGWRISKVYGSSETSSFVAAYSLKNFKNKMESSGKAIPPNEIFIVDEQKKKLPANAIGEIAIKSDATFSGYLNNDDEAKNKLVNGIYFTGDIGYIDEDGFLFVEARRTDLIVTGGENVNPFEVEKQILQHKNVKDCCVLGIEDKTWGHIVAAVIVPENKSLSEVGIKNFLKEKLAGFKVPKKVLFVENIPKTSLGKVEKEKVIALFKD